MIEKSDYRFGFANGSEESRTATDSAPHHQLCCAALASHCSGMEVSQQLDKEVPVQSPMQQTNPAKTTHSMREVDQTGTASQKRTSDDDQ